MLLLRLSPPLPTEAGFGRLKPEKATALRIRIRAQPECYYCACRLLFRPEQTYKWAWEELNLRPHAYQACALTI